MGSVKVLVVLHFYQTKSLHYGRTTPAQADRDPPLTAAPTLEHRPSTPISSETGKPSRAIRALSPYVDTPPAAGTNIDSLRSLTCADINYLVLGLDRTARWRLPPRAPAF